MTTSSKILTVTYGTFSCTLEGFDDPFTTLQMVAEYFRKLAAEDRFFGSTPQTPDADTLKRIAEENTSKGIDAELADDGIILRQTDLMATDLAGQTEQAEPDPEPAPEPEPVSSPVSSEVAEESETLVFDSIRNDDADVVEPETEETATEKTATPLTFFRSRRGDLDEAETPEEPAAAKDADANAIEAAIAASTAAAQRPSDEGEETPQSKTASQKSVEETLAAIRQNVEQAESSIEAQQAEVEEAPRTDPTDPAEETLDPLILDAETAIADEPVDDLPEAEEDIVAPEAAETKIEAGSNDTDIEDETEEDAEAEDGADIRESSLTPEQEAELAADLQAAMLVDDEAPESDTLAEQDVEQPEETVAEVAPDVEPETVPEPEIEPEIEPAQNRAALLLGSGDTSQDDGALDRLLETTKSKMDKPEQVRRMNALDQLKAAVAATEADRQIRRKSVADTHNDEDEGDAADLAAYRDDLRRAQDSARLEGLKNAAKSGPATRKPAPRPAAAPVQQSPLILVSEQRIDEAPAENTPAAPDPRREVAETDGNLALKPEFEQQTQIEDDDGEVQGIPADAFSDATSFSDFAERIGAFELTDLLEAAAAYTAIVEDRPRFSRAQVMSKLAKLNIGDAYTKEAGLRSFGKLLREGKILRVQDGQFAISKASRFSVAQRYND
jgi:hypothetical protein